MAHGFKNASNVRRCPICNKPDWCGYQLIPEGELWTCQRTSDVQKNAGVTGYDGNFYVCVGISRSGNNCFMEATTLKAAYDARGAAYTPKPIEPEYIDPVEQLPDHLLDKYYRAMLRHLTLEDLHRDYLHKEGWSDEMIAKYGIVSFPEKDFSRFTYRKHTRLKNPYRKRLAKETLASLGNPADGLKGLPGAFRNGDDWTFSGQSGIIFPQPNHKHQIHGLRVRLDYTDVPYEIKSDAKGDYFMEDGEKWYLQPMKGAFRILPDGTHSFRNDGMFKGKYRNMSSFFADENEAQKNRIVNTYKDGVESGNKLSFYFDSSRDDMYIAYITEGEKKGAFANYMLRAPFIALPGVNSWFLLFEGEIGERPVDTLKRSGCSVIVVAFDADKNFNETVMAKEALTVEALRKEGFILGVANWDISLGKGIDDLLAAGYKPTYETA